MVEFMRERDESEYVDEDGNEQENNNDVADNNGDNGDTQATPVDDQY